MIKRIKSGAWLIVLCACQTTATRPQPPNAGSWQSEAPLLVARASLVAVSNRDAIFAIGGTSANRTLALDIDRYDGRVWTPEASLPEGLNAPAAALLGTRIYVIGGFKGTGNIPTDQVLIYDLTKREWRAGKAMPTARGGIQSVVVNGKIHVIAGGNQFRTLDAHEAYDPATDTWTTLAPLPTPRGNPALAALNGRIFAIGGGGGGRPFNNVDIYDVANGTWSSGPDISPPRVAARAIAYRNAVFVFGGEAGAQALADVQWLDPNTMRWHAMATMPNAHSYAGAALWKDAVYIVGGSSVAPTTHASPGTRAVNRYHLRSHH